MKIEHLTSLAVSSGLLFGCLPLASGQAPAAKPGATAPAGGGGGAVSAEGLYATAVEAFQKGANDQALETLQSLLQLAENSGKKKDDIVLEPVYYLKGAAEFNAQKYDLAVTTLTDYLKFYTGKARTDTLAEVQMFVAQSQFFLKQYDKAQEGFKLVEKVPAFREESMLFQGLSAKESGNQAGAIEILDKLIGTDIKSNVQARAAVNLALLYGEKLEADKAVATLSLLARKLKLLPNVAAFNQAAITVGDQLIAKEKQEQALACYRLAKNKAELTALQEQRIKEMERNLASYEAMSRRVPKGAPNQWISRIGGLKPVLEESKANLPKIKEMQDVSDALLLRTAKCFYDTDKKWEAIVSYDELLRRYPESKERETAVYGMLATYQEVNQPEKALEWCDKFLKEFPKTERASEVVYLRGVIALQNEDGEKAEKIFSEILKDKGFKSREQVAYLDGNAKFGQFKYADASKAYEEYLKEFPKGDMAEEVRYRKSLCLVFSGKYEAALKDLEEFISKQKDSPYLPDAKYRKMVCLFAASQWDEVVQLADSWLKEFPDGVQAGEVLGIKGDALAGAEKDDEAANAYMLGVLRAKNDESLNYNLFEASKLWQKHGQWDKVADTMLKFVAEHPDHPTATTAMYWVARAMVKQQKVDEAKKILATEINKYLTVPRREAVDAMIMQLVQLVGKKKKAVVPAVAPAPAADAKEPAPAPPPPPPPAPAEPEFKPEVELMKYFSENKEFETSRTAQARIFIAKSQLAKMRKETEQMSTVYMDQLADFDARDLSPYILGQAADYFTQKARTFTAAGKVEDATRETDRSEKFFQEILKSYPKSDYLEMAYVGLGDVNYARGKFKEALVWYDGAINTVGAVMKLKDALFGLGRCNLELGNLDAAKKQFEQIASNKEWRGDMTAASIFYLGMVAEKKGDFSGAHAYFERIYVSYGKYTNWLGKAYLKDAEMLEKLGQKDKTRAVLQDMLRNDKVKDPSERDQARKRLGPQ